jgi:hypothetical protein
LDRPNVAATATNPLRSIPAPPRPSTAGVVTADPAPQDVPERSGSAIPFLITHPDGGESVIAVGVYIPERTERVQLDQLPPLQQSLVRRVLGLEEPEKPTI